MEHLDSFGTWVRLRRQVLHLSRSDLAQQVGCAPITLRKIEADERRPSLEIAERLAAYLDIPPDLRADFVRAGRAEMAVHRLAPPDQLAAPAPAPASNLPTPRTLLIGREREIAAAQRRLLRADVRLLTLTGPPGVGKTRLSLQIAASLADQFADGVWLVPLAPVHDASLVLSNITQTLGAITSALQPIAQIGGLAAIAEQTMLERLKLFVQHKQLLLVLDNFEHVLDAAPQLAALLDAAPQLTMLVTSRAALHISGEHEIAVPPLELPDLAALPPLAALQNTAAVNLFVQRVQAIRADFALSEENAHTIAELCHRLDGLPLAIELAAARTRVLPPADLLARLDSRLQLLTGGMRDVPQRHQTLRNAIAWSYELLNDHEQRLLRRMGAFAGGSHLAAIETLCSDLDCSTLDVLASLVDKSLIQQRSTSSGELRFDMLETIREFAIERLQAHGEEQEMRARHADYYLRFAEQAAQHQQGAQQIRWLDALEIEHDNLRAAISCSLARGQSDHALRFGAALWLFWQIRGFIGEGRDWLDRILQAAGDIASPARVEALNGAGILAYSQGDTDTAQQHCTESLALARQIGDQAGAAHALNNIGTVALEQCNYSRVLEYCAESLTISRGLGITWLSGWALLTSGYAYLQLQEIASARRYVEEGLALFRDSGGMRGHAFALLFLAELAQAEGNYEQIETYMHESIPLYQALHDTRGLACMNAQLAQVACYRGSYQRAATLLEESLEIFDNQGHSWNVAMFQLQLAHVRFQLGQPQLAAQTLAQTVRNTQPRIDSDLLFLGLMYCAEMGIASGLYDRAVQLLAAAAHIQQDMPLPICTPDTELQQLVSAARERAQADEFQRLWETGQTAPIEQVIDQVLDLCQCIQRAGTPAISA